MRYMFLVVLAPDGYEQKPSMKLMEEMTKLTERGFADGSLISTGGLMPPAMGGMRATLRRGEINVIDGPFTETKEVIGGYAIMEFATHAEARQAAVDFMELHRTFGEGWEGACEMRPLAGPEGDGDLTEFIKARVEALS